MREMIFNDVSVRMPALSIHDVRPLLCDLARGMASLVTKGSAKAILRMTAGWHAYRCADDGTIWDLLCLMQRERREVEETRFLMRLAMKAPLLADLPDEVVDRFRGCEPAPEDGVAGDCLVLCAHLCGIAVSVPLNNRFDCDRFLVRFAELSPDLSINEVEEEVDNLGRAAHASAIIARDHSQIFGNLSLDGVWTRRSTAFPNLTFGVDVREQLMDLDPHMIGPVVRRLAELNDAARLWPAAGTPAPQWHSKVTPESDSVMSNPDLRNCRIFRAADGRPELFEWHARCGSSYRIHLRFDRSSYRVEIGYIGRHLPLA